jgi:hypothetical protein
VVCDSCVEKLQKRLMARYDMGQFEAWDRAYSAINKAEVRILAEGKPVKRGPRAPTWFEAQTHKHKSGHNPDYVQDCTGTHVCDCRVVQKPTWRCAQLTACYTAGLGCHCPDPLENSHEVSDNCFNVCRCSEYSADACPEGTTCYCQDNCGYDCDPPYVWDENAQACVLPTGEYTGDGLTWKR